MNRFVSSAMALGFWVIAHAPQTTASIHDVRGLYAFSSTLGSRWSSQPPLVANGFTPGYVFSSMPDGGLSQYLNLPAFTTAPLQALVLNNWAAANGGAGINGGAAATRTNRWTLVMDIRPTFAAGRSWLSLLQTNTANNDDAELFIFQDGRFHIGGFVGAAGTVIPDTWQRLAFVCDNNGAGGTLTISAFRNGTFVGSASGLAFDGRFSISSAAYLFADDTNETNACSLGSLGFWTEPLTSADLLAMGGAKSTTPEIQWPAMPGSSARPGLSGKLAFGSFSLDLPADGFQVGSGTVLLSPNHATVTGNPTYFLSGTRNTRLAANGDLIYTGPTTFLEGSGAVRVNNVRVDPGGVTLTSSGATASAYSVTLPIGMGVASSATSRRLRQTAILGAKPLTSQLLPSDGIQALPATMFGFPAGNLHVSLETQPVRYQVSRVDWSPATGAFQVPSPSNVAFDRAYERACLLEWNGIAGVAGDPRPSNDDVFAFSTISSDILVDAHASGIARIRQGTLTFANGSGGTGYTTHFPRGLNIRWSSGGNSQLRYASSTLQPDSFLYEGLGTAIQFGRDSPQAACAAVGPKTLNFTPPDHWLFTRDGGLHAEVSLNGTAGARTLEWGTVDSSTFAHKVETAFTSGAVHIPGNSLRATEVPGLAIEHRPAALLLSGNGNGSLPETTVERPGTAAYFDGLADYAGLNLRPGGDSTHAATSRLAGTPLSYPLRSRSKYNVRRAGVTAIHEAVASAVPPGQSYTINTVLAGYPVGLSDVRLSFRDGETIASGINGAFNLPAPALLTNLAVRNLRFGPRGEFLDAEFDTTSELTLGYWGCRMTPHALFFALPDIPCPTPSSGTLVLGAEVKLPALSDQAFHGNIGFKPNGHTVVPADNLILANGEKVTSRLRPPSQLRIKGPGATEYPFTPHGGAYLNEFSGTAPPGFVALPGELNVPFFRDLRVLLNAKSSAGATAASTLEVFAGDHPPFNFFGQSDPDPGNLGKSAGLPGPRARRELWDLLDLDLPLAWNNTTRRFQGSPVADDLLLFNLQQRCSSLGPDVAEINFGASVDPLAKSISAATLLDALGADTKGLLAAMSPTVRTIVQAALVSLGQADALTADTLGKLLAPSLEATLDGTANTLFNSLKSRYASVGSASYRSTPAATDAFFLNAVIGVNGQISTAASTAWPAEVRSRLESAITACDQLDALVSDASKIANLASAIGGGGSPNTTSVAQTLADLDAAISSVRARLVATRDLFNPGQAYQVLLTSSLGTNTSIQAWLSEAIGPLKTDWVTNLDDPAGSGFFDSEARRTEFIAAFKQRVTAGLGGSVTEQNLRHSLDAIVADPLLQVRNAFDGVIQSANLTAQSSFPLPESPVATLGSFASVFNGAKMTGYARINGESLSELRLDGELKLKVPDDLSFTAWFLMRDMDGSLPGDACLAAGGVATEVSVGASAPLSFIGQEAAANVEMRVGIGPGGPVSVAGSIGIAGELDMQSITVRDPQFGVAIGAPEAYLYAKAAGELDAEAFAMSAEVALFFGKTCRLDPIQKVNGNVADILGKLGLAAPDSVNPLYGAYVYAYGDFSVLSLLGIPPTCLLDLRIGGGQGYYLFYRPAAATLAGMQFTYGVRGQAMCLLNVGGRLDGYIAAAVANNNVSLSGLSAAGRMIATLNGKIGISPFSYDWKKAFAVDVLFNPNATPKLDWSISY